MVLSLDREPWRSLEKAQRETWAGTLPPSVELVHLQGVAGGAPRMIFLAARKIAERMRLRKSFDSLAGRISIRMPVRINQGVIRADIPEFWIGTSAKMHSGLRFVAKHLKFDYLVRTNSSTYLHVPRLVEFLHAAPRENFYSGADQGEPHAQGTCIILSRDAVEKLALDECWEYFKVDDQAIGGAAQRAEIPYNPVPQVIVESVEAGLRFDYLPAPFIYRLKTRKNRLEDAKAMELLHGRLAT
ncbi:hypothetical protein [Granulicoccus sp. GXG6511]|uniref:hypothetical protein n=1 Tax=Granulicoccus sp. GXG6511 TaxID=3381351 RepID=UPI003D7CDE2B